MPTVLDLAIAAGQRPSRKDLFEQFCRGELAGVDGIDEIEPIADWKARNGLGCPERIPAGWWQHQKEVDRVILHQAAIRSALKTMAHQLGCRADYFKRRFAEWQKDKDLVEAQLRYVKRLHREVDLRLSEMLAAAQTGQTILAHAGDIERLRKALFSPEFLAAEVRKEHRAKMRRWRNAKKFAAGEGHRNRLKQRTEKVWQKVADRVAAKQSQEGPQENV